MSADVIAISLAFFGQLILVQTLATEHYGWMVLALDLYAAFFLVVDLGLPTLLARDGAQAPTLVVRAMKRIYRLQFLAILPFLVLAFVLRPDHWLNIDAPPSLLICAGAVALVHIASYAPRSGLRALGEARLEAISKASERLVTVLGYGALYLFQSTSPVMYTLAFFVGAAMGWVLSLVFIAIVAPPQQEQLPWVALGKDWRTTRSLLFAALPFALTLAVLPYVIRLEKFFVAISSGAHLAAVFHVAQLAWLAGLVVPMALRSALLPVLGQQRTDRVRLNMELHHALDLCFGLLPIGMFGGYFLVAFLAPLAFPLSYLDGTYGASAVDIFAILLAGWSFNMLATPTYTSLMAGQSPWKFAKFIFAVMMFAAVIGSVLIIHLATTPMSILYAAAVASSASAAVALVLSWLLSAEWDFVYRRKDDFALAMMSILLVSIGLVTHTVWWVFGLPLFGFIPRGWRAVHSTLG